MRCQKKEQKLEHETYQQFIFYQWKVTRRHNDEYGMFITLTLKMKFCCNTLSTLHYWRDLKRGEKREFWKETRLTADFETRFRIIIYR